MRTCLVTKGNKFSNFIFASMDDEKLRKWGLLLKGRICSCGSKFFPLRVDPNFFEERL